MEELSWIFKGSIPKIECSEFPDIFSWWIVSSFWLRIVYHCNDLTNPFIYGGVLCALKSDCHQKSPLWKVVKYFNGHMRNDDQSLNKLCSILKLMWVFSTGQMWFSGEDKYLQSQWTSKQWFHPSREFAWFRINKRSKMRVIYQNLELKTWQKITGKSLVYLRNPLRYLTIIYIGDQVPAV